MELWNSVGASEEQWKTDSGTVGWNSGTVEQCWLNSGTVIVEQCRWNSVVEQWNSNGGTVLVEQCGGTLRWNSVGGTAIVAQ